MSLVAISGNASGTGTLTIAAPNTNSNRTLTLPDGTGTFNISGVVNEVPAGTVSAPSIYPTGDTNTGIFFPAADTIAFAEGGAESMRIDTSGRLLVGTSTSPSSADIKNVLSSTTGAFTQYSYNGGAGAVVGALGTSTLGFYTYTGNIGAETYTERMRIDSSGALILVGSTAQKATGTTWSNPSDERLKDNIRDYAKGLAELMQVRVREWEYNGKGGTVEGTKGLGVVANEIMTVLPDTVENYDAKLNADDEETTAIKKFDATEITWLLVKTVQEQQALITQLQTDVAELKGLTP